MATVTTTFTSSARAVLDVAHAVSDLVFVYPLLPSLDAVSHAAAHLDKVVTLDVGANAASVVRGAIANNNNNSSGGKTHVAVFLAAPHLPLFVPSLVAIAQQHVPVVVHVACETVTRDLAASSSYEAVYALQHTGAVLLHAATPQEGHDLAIAAHALAERRQQLVVQFYDATRMAQELGSLQIVSEQALRQLVVPNNNTKLDKVKASVVSSAPSAVIDDTQAVLDELASVVHTQHQSLEYVGPNDAETVVVVLGDAAPALRKAAAGRNVGLLIVRVLLPWSHIKVAAILPSAPRTVAVIENISVAGLHSHQALLTQCVQSFFHSLVWRNKHDVVPEIRTGVYGGKLGHSGFSIGMARAVLDHAEAVTAASARGFAIVRSQDEISSDVLEQLTGLDVVYGQEHVQDAIGSQFLVFGYNDLSEQAQSIETRFTSILQALNRQTSTKVRALVQYSTPESSQSYSVAGLRVQVAAKGDSDLPLIDAPAKLVVVEHIELLKTLDVAKSIQDGGSLVVYGDHKTLEQLEGDAALRSALAAKQISLSAVDPEALQARVKDEEIADTTPVITFLRASGLVDENVAFDLLQQELPENKHKRLRVQIASAWNSFVAFPLETTSEPEQDEDSTFAAVPWASLTPSKLSYSLGACQRVHASRRIARRVSVETQTLQKLIFREALAAKNHVRAHATDVLRVTKWERLTPNDYNRNVFHLELDIRGTSITYKIGEALAVLAPNDEQQVLEFLKLYGADAEELVTLSVTRRGQPTEEETLTYFQLFAHVLDVFGRPSKKFYAALAERATESKEKELLERLVSPEGKDEYKRRVDETVTFAELLIEFPSARPTLDDLITLVPRIKPRHYSIASSIKMHPDSVHLLVVVHDWKTPSGRHRVGHATRFLSQVVPGQMISVAVCSSVMKMPTNPADPIVMAGLGTGMAPFRAFIQERAFFKAQGVDVGPISLYFGSRHRSKEFLYGDELEKYEKQGLLHLRCAFSRDQEYKIYIQDRIAEDKKLLSDWFLQQNAHFYLCGPTWPVGDVRDALVSSFKSEGGLEHQQANATIERMRDEGRYVLEVY